MNERIISYHIYHNNMVNLALQRITIDWASFVSCVLQSTTRVATIGVRMVQLVRLQASTSTSVCAINITAAPGVKVRSLCLRVCVCQQVSRCVQCVYVFACASRFQVR